MSPYDEGTFTVFLTTVIQNIPNIPPCTYLKHQKITTTMNIFIAQKSPFFPPLKIEKLTAKDLKCSNEDKILIFKIFRSLNPVFQVNVLKTEF